MLGVITLVSVLLPVGHIHHPAVDRCSQIPPSGTLLARSDDEGGAPFAHLAHVNDNNDTEESRILAASAWVFESGVVMMRQSLQYDDDHRKDM